MLGRKGYFLCLLLWVFFTLVLPSVGLAADGGGYLSGYENQDPAPNGTPGVSWWSTIAYVASLVVVFLFVAGLAYYVSKIWVDVSGVRCQVAAGACWKIFHLALAALLVSLSWRAEFCYSA